jgi:hypothetical protein
VKTGLVYSLGAAQVQIREGGGTLIEEEGHRECRFGRRDGILIVGIRASDAALTRAPGPTSGH